MTTVELIEIFKHKDIVNVLDYIDAAVDHLTSLQDRVFRLEKALDAYRHYPVTLEDMERAKCKERILYERVDDFLLSQSKELMKVKMERDAAIADLTLVCVEGRASCDVCVFGATLPVCDDLNFDCNCCPTPCPCKFCRLDSNWQWRGTKGIKEN